MIRRYLSVLLFLVVILAVCCSGASAETAVRTIQGDQWQIIYEMNGETARILKMTFTNANTNSSPQDFIIPSSVAGIPAPLAKNVTFQIAKGYSTPVLAGSNVIKLEEGITGIADWGFAGSEYLAYYYSIQEAPVNSQKKVSAFRSGTW